MRQRPLWIVEPPLSTGERMRVNDPLRSLARFGPNGSVVPTAEVVNFIYFTFSHTKVLILILPSV